MWWKPCLRDNSAWRITADFVVICAMWSLAVAAPSGMPFSPSVDPFAPLPNPPPPANYAPQYAPPPPQQRPPVGNNNVFAMPPPQPQQIQYGPQPQPPMNYNPNLQQYMGPPPPRQNPGPVYPVVNQAPPPPQRNLGPVYPVMNQAPPPDAAPVGATAPGTSNQGEMEFESGSGGGGGGGGWGTSSNYIYPPNYAQAYAQPAPGHFVPPSLLDAYYHSPYQQGQSYYQYQMAQRNRNNLFGGLFGNTPSGNMFGALMLNEFVF